MVEIKTKKIEERYFIGNTIEKKFVPLFKNAKTRKSEELIETEKCKLTTEKKETKKVEFF